MKQRRYFDRARAVDFGRTNRPREACNEHGS